MNDKARFIFLLGGADLEMHTIRQLLDKNGYRYYDKHLRWENACLSAYRKEITDYTGDDTPLWVGIELQEDMNLPSNYISIDHHNRNAHKPSSLEQVAELLEIPLSRQEQLIAANDRAYIPGMKALQASDAEIAGIRQADRAFQGVTEEEEKLAELAIREHIQVCDNLIAGYQRTYPGLRQPDCSPGIVPPVFSHLRQVVSVSFPIGSYVYGMELLWDRCRSGATPFCRRLLSREVVLWRWS